MGMYWGYNDVTLVAGFYAYLSLLTVINAHDHPVVKVAVKLLMDGVRNNKYKNHQKEDFSMFGKNLDCYRMQASLYRYTPFERLWM